jgi:hypothetical protein
MKFALVLIFLFPDGTSIAMPWAETYDERTCAIAGAGSAEIMAEANPHVTVGYSCDPLEALTS